MLKNLALAVGPGDEEDDEDDEDCETLGVVSHETRGGFIGHTWDARGLRAP